MVEISYLLYLAIAIGITIWVARTLSHNGEVFWSSASATTPSSPTRPTICWWSASTW